MKFRANKLNLNLVLVSSLLAASIPAFAVTGDTGRPIHIESDQQSLDMQGNVVTFTDDVIVTQGTIKINADKVVVTHPGDGQDKEMIDGYGKPTAFYQMQDNGKPVENHAPRIYYELAGDSIALAGNACLQQVNSGIKGNRITCLVREQKIQALSDRGKRITIVLVPSQLQDKNNRDQTPAWKKGN